MARIEYTGTLLTDPNRTLRTVVWEDGSLSGDDVVIDFLREDAKDFDGTRLGPPEGPFSVRDHLKTDVGFVMLVERRMTVYSMTGSLIDRGIPNFDGDLP